MVHVFLKKGDRILLGDEHTVYANIPERLAYSNRPRSNKLVTHEVDLKGNFEYLQGEYEVFKTETSGGGQGHGRHDTYPNGYKVFCKHVVSGEKVSFYQSGCFTAMITDITPISKSK